MYSEGIANTNVTLSNDIKTAMLRFILYANSLMQTTALSGWSSARYMDFILSIHWLIDESYSSNNNNGWQLNDTMVGTLIDTAKLAKEQGFTWEYWFEHLPEKAVQPINCTLYTHGVNNAQALKSAAVWFRQTNNETLRQLSISRMQLSLLLYTWIKIFPLTTQIAKRQMPSRWTFVIFCFVFVSVFYF